MLRSEETPRPVPPKSPLSVAEAFPVRHHQAAATREKITGSNDYHGIPGKTMKTGSTMMMMMMLMAAAKRNTNEENRAKVAAEEEEEEVEKVESVAAVVVVGVWTMTITPRSVVGTGTAMEGQGLGLRQ